MNALPAFPLAQAEGDFFGFLHQLKGPDFLLLYFLWFLFLWVAVLMIRRFALDSPLTTLAGLLLFEGLGVARFVAGSSHGMHKWDIQILMMAVAPLFFVIRLRNLNRLR